MPTHMGEPLLAQVVYGPGKSERKFITQGFADKVDRVSLCR